MALLGAELSHGVMLDGLNHALLLRDVLIADESWAIKACAANIAVTLRSTSVKPTGTTTKVSQTVILVVIIVTS